MTTKRKTPAKTSPIVNAAANQIQRFFMQGGVYAEAKHNHN